MPLPRQSERWIFNPDRNHPAFELKNQVIALQREFLRVGQNKHTDYKPATQDII